VLLHIYVFQVSRGADIERRDVNLMTPLMWAATEGHTDVVKVLIRAGAHISQFSVDLCPFVSFVLLPFDFFRTDFTDLNLYCIKGALALFVLVSFSGYVC